MSNNDKRSKKAYEQDIPHLNNENIITNKEQNENRTARKIKDAIGRATATEKTPNSSEKFTFWLKPGIMINPFDFIEANQNLNDSSTYGLVTNIHHSTDAPSHLSNYIANDFGELFEEPNTPRQGTNVAEVSVLANTKDTYMPIQNEALIWFAEENGIHSGLGIDSMKQKEKLLDTSICIPAGIIEMSNGTEAVAYFDKEYLIGPEGAHVNISGISGLATKTSYIIFLIQSILQTLDRDGKKTNEQVKSNEVSVVLVNVKYNDLLAIDESLETDISDNEKRIWNKLKLEPKPFNEVKYLLPVGTVSVKNSKKANCYKPQPPDEKSKLYAYELKDCVDKLEAMFSNVPDEYGTIESIIGYVKKGFEEKEKGWDSVRTWDDLLYKSPLNEWAKGSRKAPGALQQRSVERFIRYLTKFIKNRTTGLFVNNRDQNWVSLGSELRNIKGGYTYVIDIAKLYDNEQMLVFGDIVRTIYDIFSGVDETDINLDIQNYSEDKKPKKVILFVDELNKYAPSERGRISPFLQDLLEISERGRSLGVILLSAQQFASSVHDRITGNASTKVFGRTDPVELSQSNYRFLKEDVKMHLTRLEKGELVITHPLYRQPIKIKFPKPIYKQNK